MRYGNVFSRTRGKMYSTSVNSHSANSWENPRRNNSTGSSKSLAGECPKETGERPPFFLAPWGKMTAIPTPPTGEAQHAHVLPFQRCKNSSCLYPPGVQVVLGRIRSEPRRRAGA